MLPSKTDVLIVGAGPTGLALAVALQKSGVDHLLIDELAEGQNTSRAAVVHAHTLEALDSIEVTDELVRHGLELTRFTIRDRDRPLLEIDFQNLPSKYRSLLMVPQSTTEAVFTERLVGLGGRIYRNTTALSAERDGLGAIVRVGTAQGERLIQARYVVGADGMHSVVRGASGIEFHGDTDGTSFVLADVRMQWALGMTEVSLFFSPEGLVVVAPLPDGSFRIVATLDVAPEVPSVSLIQQLLAARGPTDGISRVDEIVWGSRFRVHHRLAETYREGPFLLMGDAAHVHSPAGGQGMNTGLIDAIVLGEALARILKDGGPESVLDDYAAVRRPAAKEVSALAGRLTKLATIQSPALRAIRNILFRIFNRAKGVRHIVSLNLSGISRRTFSTLPRTEP